MEPFRPYGPTRQTMQYYQLPEDLLEDVDGLRDWVAKSIKVALRKKGRPGSRGRA